MVFTLIGKEMRDQMSGLRFAISLILAFFFLIASTYMLADDSSWSGRLIFTGEKIKDHVYTNGYSWYWVTRNVPALRVLATGLDENLSLNSESMLVRVPLFSNNRTLMVSSTYVLIDEYATRIKAYDDSVTKHLDAMKGIKAFSRLSVMVDRPPSKMSFLCVGSDRKMGNVTEARYNVVPVKSIGRGTR